MESKELPVYCELDLNGTYRWIHVTECVPPFVEEHKSHQRSARVPVIIRDPHPRVDSTRYYRWKEDGRYSWGKNGVTHWLPVPAIPSE